MAKRRARRKRPGITPGHVLVLRSCAADMSSYGKAVKKGAQS